MRSPCDEPRSSCRSLRKLPLSSQHIFCDFRCKPRVPGRATARGDTSRAIRKHPHRQLNQIIARLRSSTGCRCGCPTRGFHTMTWLFHKPVREERFGRARAQLLLPRWIAISECGRVGGDGDKRLYLLEVPTGRCMGLPPALVSGAQTVAMPTFDDATAASPASATPSRREPGRKQLPSHDLPDIYHQPRRCSRLVLLVGCIFRAAAGLFPGAKSALPVELNPLCFVVAYAYRLHRSHRRQGRGIPER